MRTGEKGMRMYVALLKILSIARRGEVSERTTKAIKTANNSLTHRFKDNKGRSDQKTLISIKTTSVINQAFLLIAPDQSKFLLTRMIKAARMRVVWNARSKGLPWLGSALHTRNHAANGLVALTSIHIVGIQSARLTSVVCLCSSRRRKITKAVQRTNASVGGKYVPPY